MPLALVCGVALMKCGCAGAVGGAGGSSGNSSGAGESGGQTAVVVTVTPTTASIATGGEQLFTASVDGAGTAGAGVAWAVNGVAGGSASLGTIATTGAMTAIYTAPLVPPSPATLAVNRYEYVGGCNSGQCKRDDHLRGSKFDCAGVSERDAR